LFAVRDSRNVLSAPHDVIPHTWQVPDSTSPNQDDRMRLDIVTLTGDVGSHLEAIGKPHPGNGAPGRISLRGVRTPAQSTTPRNWGRFCKARLLLCLRGFLLGLRTN
jgi:hypothetical protein